MAFGIPNIEQAVSNFIEGGRGITAIRSVEFEKRFLWTVDFIGGGDSYSAPEPFDKLFPASNVDFNLATLTSHEFDQGQSVVKFPRRGGLKNMSVTFYDNEKRALLNWFRDWIELDILNNGEYMSGLLDSHALVTGSDSFGVARRVYPIRQIRVALLDSWKNEVQTLDYMVYPEQDLNWSGAQDSEASTYTINFAIVEDLGAKRPSSAGFSFQDVKSLIGRFI